MKTTLCNVWLGPRRASFLRSLGWMLLGVAVVGCPAGRTEKVVIRGSNTFGEELAPQLIAEYTKEHPAVAFDLEFKGTAYGMGALMAERCDIAAASRTPTANELDLAKSRDVEFCDHIIGSYSEAVIVHADNPVGNLTPDQVRDIFTGAIQNWKEVGGPDAPIHLHIRDPISGTHLGFRELAMENKPYAHAPKTFTNYTGIVQAVEKDANGIGHASLVLAKHAGVKTVSIGGVAPSAEAVNQGKYPYARAVRLYTNKTKEGAAARDFIQFVHSTRGQEILAQMGFVPRP
jgi:phosphate transport system substrate-binding protein